MIITVASGKGGTGKTMIATSLALSLASRASNPIHFIDCDVEAPNAHLFLHPEFTEHQEVSLPIPSIDEKKCTHCGKCAEICQFHAIAVLGQKTLVFPQLCHGCGSCTALCPEHAIEEIPNIIGVVERGATPGGIEFSRGILQIGEPMAVPVIRQLLLISQTKPEQVTIRDSPPGTSCPVVETMHGSDYLLLVTEPTPFGLHDLKLAVQVGQVLKIPCGVIINRTNGSYAEVDNFCNTVGLPIILQIPFKREIAESIAQGNTLLDILPEYADDFQYIYAYIQRTVFQTQDYGCDR